MLPSHSNLLEESLVVVLSLLDQIAFACASKFRIIVSPSVDTVNFLKSISGRTGDDEG
jgi:acyl-CoA hydrolase